MRAARKNELRLFEDEPGVYRRNGLTQCVQIHGDFMEPKSAQEYHSMESIEKARNILEIEFLVPVT